MGGRATSFDLRRQTSIRSAPGPAPNWQRTAAIRPWRPGRPAADPAGSPTAPCAGGSPCRRGERPGDDALETDRPPRCRTASCSARQPDPTVDGAPVGAKIETVADDRLEVVLHQPLLDQVRLGERAPDLFRRIRHLPFDDDGARFGRSIGHWSILLSRSSRSSNRLCQKPAIWLVQSISGASAPSCAL